MQGEENAFAEEGEDREVQVAGEKEKGLEQGQLQQPAA